MKFIKIIIFAIIITLAPLNANSNAKKFGVIAAAIVLVAVANQNLQKTCKPIDYKNYILDKEMYTNPAVAMLNNKYDACASKIAVYTGLEKNTPYYKILVAKNKSAEFTKKEDGYKIYIAEDILTTSDILSSKEVEQHSIYVDENGIVFKADSLLKQMIGKKLFNMIDKISIIDKTFSQEIIYTGISGNNLHLQYREYRGNLIRAPFTLNLIFDLNKSNIIKIKQYEIHIIEANNSQIVYKIIE